MTADAGPPPKISTIIAMNKKAAAISTIIERLTKALRITDIIATILLLLEYLFGFFLI